MLSSCSRLGSQRTSWAIGSTGDVRMRLVTELDVFGRQVPTGVRDHSNSCHVTGLINVVGSAEDSVEHGLRDLVPSRLRLVRPDDKLQVVGFTEPLRNVWPEGVNHGDAAGGPIAIGALGVTPEEVDHQWCLKWVRLGHTIHCLDLRQSHLRVAREDAGSLIWCLHEEVLPDTRVWSRDASVDNEDLILENRGKRKISEGLAEEAHHLLLVFDLHLPGESILGVGHLALVVTAVKVD
mmetsp:Transcript_63262/g.137627  ORF Transcript_63262/g.137627 Transcript_63262/m.137627 type:complete len:237 (+) Transcript_63262:82-792(+)